MANLFVNAGFIASRSYWNGLCLRHEQNCLEIKRFNRQSYWPENRIADIFLIDLK